LPDLVLHVVKSRLLSKRVQNTCLMVPQERLFLKLLELVFFSCHLKHYKIQNFQSNFNWLYNYFLTISDDLIHTSDQLFLWKNAVIVVFIIFCEGREFNICPSCFIQLLSHSLSEPSNPLQITLLIILFPLLFHSPAVSTQYMSTPSTTWRHYDKYILK